MSPMLMQSLHLQWKIARWPLVPFVVAAFGIPLAAMRWADRSASGSTYAPALEALSAVQLLAGLFPATAALIGVTIGLTAWSWDHRANHVYALSLPVSRTRYTTMKMAAGALVLLVPVGAAWLGALLGAATADLPDGLHAYPHAFGLRFLLAALIIYAVTFALAAGTTRTAVLVITGSLAFVIFGTLLVDFIELITGRDDLWTPLQLAFAALADWPGPFHVFGGNWMLVDV